MRLQHSGDDGSPEGGMIHIGIACHIDKIQLPDSARLHVRSGNRKEPLSRNIPLGDMCTRCMPARGLFYASFQRSRSRPSGMPLSGPGLSVIHPPASCKILRSAFWLFHDSASPALVHGPSFPPYFLPFFRKPVFFLSEPVCFGQPSLQQKLPEIFDKKVTDLHKLCPPIL